MKAQLIHAIADLRFPRLQKYNFSPIPQALRRKKILTFPKKPSLSMDKN